MKYEELAKNLVKYRNKKKLSIEEVSSILNINVKKLDEYESGKIKPSYSHLKKLASLYDIQVTKIISEKSLLDSLISKQRLDKIEFVIISVLILLLIFTASYITDRKSFNNGKDLIYEFKGESKTFIFEEGILVMNDKTRYIELSDFNVKNNLNLRKLVINIAFNESIWKVDEINSCTNIECKNWLNNISYKEYTYNKAPLHKLEKEDSFVDYKDNFPNDFKVEINYCTDVECTVEILDVTAKKINLEEN